jgi:hypothetical protein
MTKAALWLLLIGLAGSGAMAAQDGAQPVTPTVASALRESAAGQPQNRCKSDDPKAVIVCGRSQHRYRIDPGVLAAERAVETPAAKGPISFVPASGQTACVGPKCGSGADFIPVVGIALVALRAATLAAHGEDWRDAFRTHEDEYQAYQDSQAKQAKGGVSVGVSAGNK